jgi:hypothetical protein
MTLQKPFKRLANTAVVGLLLLWQLGAPVAVAAHENTNDPEYWCGSNSGVKFDTGAVGTHSQNVSGGSVDVTIVNTGKTEVSNVTGTGVSITKTIIKGGSTGGNGGNGNQVYTPPFSYNLKAPNNNGGQQSDISHVIVCYSKKDTTVEIIKKLNPADDPGKFNLAINNKTTSNVGNNGTTGKVVVNDAEDVVIAEAAGTNTDLGNYTTAVACVDQNGDTIALSDIDVTGDDRDAKIAASTIGSGDDIVCTFTNTRKTTQKTGNLKVIKDVVNNNGSTKTAADFTFKINAGDTPRSFDLTTNGDGEKIVTLPVGTSFAVSEVEANTDGYTTSYSNDCTGTITENQTTCIITNTDQPGTLIVKKVLITDNGSQAVKSDFSFSVNSGSTMQFEADGQNDLSVGAGSYSVTETNAPGFVTTYDNCENVNIENGETEICTITNDDIDPKLTIVKQTTTESDRQFNFTSNQGNFSLRDGESYAFGGNDSQAGEYTITEQELSGWDLQSITCTDQSAVVNLLANSVTLTLHVGDNTTCTFVNQPRSTISGYKWNDQNANSELDENEGTLADWTITLHECGFNEDERVICNEEAVATTTTDEDGYYEFADLLPGFYGVCETEQDGWQQSFPAQGQYECHYIFIEGSGQHEFADFGNFRLGTIEGVIFNDVNGNTEQEEGEPYLAEWTVSLFDEGDDPIATTSTNASGYYQFANLLPGTYTVCQTLKATWTRTFPAASNCQSVTIDPPTLLIHANFGNKAKPQVLDAATTTTPAVLVNTGVDVSKHIAVALTILSVLGAVHVLSNRRKNYTK